MATSNVERGATSSIDWVGSLSRVPLAEVFRKIAFAEASGDLQVHLGAAIKTIYFQKGFVVFAASDQQRDRLGESLIEAGRISRHEFALASMLMKSSKKKFGEALVQAGVMSEEELGRQVAMQVNRIVLSLFKAKEGVYSFDERGTAIPVDLMVSLSIYRILLEGIRYMSDGKLILAGLPPLDSVVRVAERAPFTLDGRKLKPVEESILKTAGLGSPLAELIRAVEADRGVALRACYGLYAAGLLEPASERQRRHLNVQEETGVFVLSDIQHKFAKIQATNARQEILMEFDRLDRSTDEEILNLEGPIEPEMLETAYEKRLSEWDEKRVVVDDQKTLVAKIDVIQQRLQRAYANMREESSRLDERDERSRPAEDAPVLLETPAERTLPPLNEELFEEIDVGAIQEALTAEPSPLTAGRRPDQMEPLGPSTKGIKVSPQLYGAAKVERVRQLLRDIKLHFQVRDWEHAVSLLYELVELEPHEAKHHGMLARAMARHPVMRKDAERHFIEALRLAPQDADLHFSLGLYYKSFGMHFRAQTSFRTALRINPKHEGAIKHLSGGARTKDPLRGVFKKIFG